MKRFLIFILIFQFASGNILGSEVVKLPFLLRHFRLHVAAKPADTWLDFLRLHYANTQHRQTDPAHGQLPLHSAAVPAHTLSLLPASVEFPVLTLVNDERGRRFWPDETLLPAGFKSRLLRPPRG